MLEFVIGVPGSGKTDYIMRRAASDARMGRRAVLLTTRQATHAMERRLVRDYVKDGLLSVQVLDVDRFAQRVLDDTGGGAGERMSALGRMMAIRAALSSCQKDLTLYRRSLSQPGFCARVAAQLDAFSRWQVTGQDLACAAEKTTDAQLRKKLADVALIALSCRAYFESHGCAWVDPLTLAAQRVQRCAWVRDCTFYLDGLQSEDAATRALLTATLGACRSMFVTVAMDAAHAQQTRFDAPRSAMAAFEKMARECGVPVQKTVLEAGERTGALAHLRQNLFVYPGRVFSQKTSRIVLETCRDPRSEAEYAAGLIVRLCRQEGMRFRDFTVVCANGESGFSQIRRAFERFGVSAFYDMRKKLCGSAAAGVLQRLVNACRAPWRSADILALLKSDLTCFDAMQVCHAENLILKRGIDGPARWKREWKGEDARQAEQVRRAAVEILDPFFKSMAGSVRTDRRVEALFDVLEKLQVRTKLEETVVTLQKNGAAQEAAVTAQIWNVICELLGQLSYVMGGEAFTLAEFAAMIREGLLSMQLGVIPTTLDQVTVSTFSRWNGEGARVVLITGATDEAMCPPAGDEALLNDADAAELLTQADLTVARTAGMRAGEFKAQVYRALCAASQSIVMTRPLRDMAGQPTGAPQLASHLRRMFPQREQMKADALPVCVQDGFSRWASGMRRRADGFPAPAWLDAAGQWFSSHEAWRLRAQRVERALRLEHGESLSPQLASALFAAPLHMSVTQLERYAGCPFAHFARYALGARAREEFSEGARADTGSFVHEMLCRLGRDMASGAVDVNGFDEAAGQAWTREAFLALDEEMGYYAWLARSAAGRAIRQRLFDNVCTAAVNMVRSVSQSAFDVAQVECELPPVVLENEASQQIRLVGRIDRVDVARLLGGDAARVIDYKSSAKNTALSEIYYARHLQLAAYLLAVCENPALFASEKLTPGGMLYFPIGDQNTADSDSSRMQGIVNDDDEIMAAMDTAPTQSGRSQIVAPVSRGARSGRVTNVQMQLLLRFVKEEMTRLAFQACAGDARAYPAWTSKPNERGCAWCDYAGACGFDARKRPLCVNRMPDMKDEQTLEKMLSKDKDGAEQTDDGGHDDANA